MKRKGETKHMKSTGNWYVIKNGTKDIVYLRHNNSYTSNILLAMKFDREQDAVKFAANFNRGLTEGEITRKGASAVELMIRVIA